MSSSSACPQQVPTGQVPGPWPQWALLLFLLQFVSSFQKTELEASCVGCTVLGYR